MTQYIIIGLPKRNQPRKLLQNWRPRLIHDIIHHTEQYNIEGLVMFIDVEKALDYLGWEFLYKELEASILAKYLSIGSKL